MFNVNQLNGFNVNTVNNGPYATGTQTFTSNDTFTVPTYVTSIQIKVWGAAGGSDSAGLAGGGGYVEGTLAVTPGHVYAIAVGGGGTIVGRGGGGGGYTGVFDTSISFANAIAVAGGGGGASNYSACTGGDGGGSTGETGSNGTGATTPAGGGTGGSQVAGGTGGVAGVGGAFNEAGNAGGQLSGGDGGRATTNSSPRSSASGSGGTNGGGDAGESASGTEGSSAGGGAGYYGGGGSGASDGTGDVGGGGGGGGSNYVHGSLTSTTSTQATNGTPANTGDADYVSGKGQAVAYTAGGDGYVVINWGDNINQKGHTMSEQEKKERWHVGKEIPLAMVVMILTQTFGIVWWASAINNRVEAIENVVPKIAEHAARIAVLEAQGDDIRNSMTRIEIKVDRLLERKQFTKPISCVIILKNNKR